MFRLLIFFIVGYFVLKIVKSLLAPKKDQSQVKGKAKKQDKRSINKKQIEDADYEEID